MLAVALVSATPNSPFSPVLPAGYEPSGPLRWISDLIGLGHLSTTGLIAAGLVATAAAAGAFLYVVREAWNNRISMRTVVILTVSFHAAVVTLPLLFSRDVYSYGYYGRIVNTYGANPYVFTPKDFPLNSLWHLTWPGWRGTPSVYGPLFTWVSAFMTGIAKSIPDLITGFQLLAAAASLGTIAIVGGLARRVRPERAVFAVAAIGLNPIVVFHVVGGGHNDMLVAFFIAGAAALLFAKRELLSAVALALGMSVKATAVVPLILLVVAVAANTPPERRRRVLLTFAGVVGGVWLLLAIPYLQASNPTLGLMEVAGHDSWMAPGQLVVRLFSGTGGLLGGDPFREPAATVARVILFGLSAVSIVLLAREIWRRPTARTPTALVAAWGWALLVLILPSPVLFTWYLVWVLPLAWALPRIARRGIVILSAFFIVTQLVTESSRLPDFLESVKLPFGHPIAIAVCVWVGLDLIRRLRRGIPFEGESAEPTFGDAFESGPHPREPVPTRLGAVRPMPATTMRRK
jgi:alpha-1,6-mannosyltransferase